MRTVYDDSEFSDDEHRAAERQVENASADHQP
jgi:hypothetical protein